MYNFVRQHYVGLYCYSNVLMFFITKITEYRSMFWSLRIFVFYLLNIRSKNKYKYFKF